MNHSAITRYAWASTRSRRVHGATRPASGATGLEKGTLFELDQIDLPMALQGFDAAAADPGSFSIVTRDQTRVDFLFGSGGLIGLINRLLRRPAALVTLDIWFEEDPDQPLADVHAVPAERARAFVEAVYMDVPDSALWQQLGLPRVDA